MNKKTIRNLMIVLAVVILAVGFSLPCITEPLDYMHSGKQLFNEVEYQEFKTKMASDEVYSLKADILNHDFPMLIEYSYKSDNEIKIYGNEKVNNVRNDVLVMFALLAIIPFAIAMDIQSLYR